MGKYILKSIGGILMLIGAWHFFLLTGEFLRQIDTSPNTNPGHYDGDEINKKIKLILEKKNLPLQIDLRDVIKGDWLLICLGRPYQNEDPWLDSFPGWSLADDLHGFRFFLLEKGQTFFVDRYLYYDVISSPRPKSPLARMLETYEPSNECMTRTGAILYKKPIDCDALAKSAKDISIPFKK